VAAHLAAFRRVGITRPSLRSASVAVCVLERRDEASVVGQGCDDQFEFEFALDLLLDGLGRLR